MSNFKPGDTVWIVPPNYLRVGVIRRILVSFDEKIARVQGKFEVDHYLDDVFPSQSLAAKEAQRRRDLEVARLRSRIENLMNLNFYE